MRMIVFYDFPRCVTISYRAIKVTGSFLPRTALGLASHPFFPFDVSLEVFNSVFDTVAVVTADC